MLSYIPPEVWHRLSSYYYLIDSDRGGFIDRRLKKKFSEFKESLREFKEHFAQYGGYVNLPGGMELSIRNKDEIGLPLSEQTRREGGVSNRLATVVYEKSAEFENFLRVEHGEIFDSVNYDNDFDRGRGGFSYKEDKEG